LLLFELLRRLSDFRHIEYQACAAQHDGNCSPPPSHTCGHPAHPQIDPKRAIPRAEHERTAKVFVGGLAPGVTSDSLKVFLGQFGQVMDATVMFDRDTGRSKGFAFATFADEDTVGVAMAASGIELEGKQVG
jgi:hypothetical protein